MNALVIWKDKQQAKSIEREFALQAPFVCAAFELNTKDALKRMDAVCFDAILFDMDSDGALDFLMELRTDGYTMPVTAVVQPHDKEIAVKAGASEISVKEGEFVRVLPKAVVWGYVKYLLDKEGVAADYVLKLSDDILRSKQRWQLTVDAVTDYIFVTDSDGIVVTANKSFAERAGRHPREIVGLDASDVLGSGAEGAFKVRRNSRHTSPDTQASFEITVGDVIYSARIFPAMFEEKEVFVHVLKNITEVKRLREQLYHSDKLTSLGQLVSEIAHEMNNPLTGIMGYAEMLSSSVYDPKLRDKLEKIYQSADRCRRFIEKLLYFSRWKSAHRSMENINDVVEGALELRAFIGMPKRIIIKRNYGGINYVFADGQQIQQVILNLLMNAEQAMADKKEGCEIEISTGLDESKNKVYISVADCGPGISLSTLKQIFEPFYTTKPIGVGTGLGLSIAKSIVEEHGGRLYADNRESGGAVFTIELEPSGIK